MSQNRYFREVYFMTPGLLKEYDVNALGPLRVAKGIESKLKSGSKLILISSMLASIQLVETNAPEVFLGYRMSKAALNMLGKMLAVNWKTKGIAVGIFNPGVIQTDMSGHIGITPTECVKQLLLNFNKLSIENTGNFWNLFPGLKPYNGTGPFMDCFPELEEGGSEFCLW